VGRRSERGELISEKEIPRVGDIKELYRDLESD
jgi:hypothetical protein